MTIIVVAFFRLFVAGLCVAAAGNLALSGKDGWGWFLTAALILGCITVENRKGAATQSAEPPKTQTKDTP